MHRTRMLAAALAGLVLIGNAHARAAEAGRAPQAWAVVVGVERYEDKAWPPRAGAARGARALGRWFAQTAGWGGDHVVVLHDQGNPAPGAPADRAGDLKPLRANLDWALGSWLTHRARAGDVVVLAFTGRAAEGRGVDYLVPIDGRPDQLADTAWNPDRALDDLVLKRGCTAVAWIDAPLPDQAADRLMNRLARWPGASVWMSRGGEIAPPLADALLRALGDRPGTLLECLEALRRDPILAAAGFRTRGGLHPGAAVWPAAMVPADAARPQLVLQHGHARRVTALATSADGDRLASASLDSTVRVWRVGGGERALVRVLPDHWIGATALAASADGRRLASGDGAGRVHAYDLAADRPLLAGGASPHAAPLKAVAFGPGGGRFVAVDENGLCALWDATGPTLNSRPLLEAGARALAAARDRGDGAVAFLVAGADGKLHPFTDDGRRIASKSQVDRPTAVDLAPDGRRAAVGSADGAVRLWDAGKDATTKLAEFPGPVVAVRLGPGGLLAVAAGGALHLTNLAAGGAGRKLDPLDGEVVSLAFSPDGRGLAAVTAAGDLHAWDLADPDAPRPIDGVSSDFAACVAFAPDGLALFAGEGDGSIRSWDLKARRERPSIPPHQGQVARLAGSADGRWLLQVNRQGYAQVWDLQDGRGPRTLDGEYADGAFLPDGNGLVLAQSADGGGRVVRVERASGRVRDVKFEPPPARGGDGPSRANFGRVAVSPDGRRVAASAAAGRAEVVCLWGIDGGAPRVFDAQAREITALQFSADGRTLLTAGEDGTARLWDIGDAGAAPRERRALLVEPSRGAVTAAALATAGPGRVAAAFWAPHRRSRVLLWGLDAPADAAPLDLGELEGRVHAVAFSADGQYLVAAGDGRRPRAWRLEPGRPPRRIDVEPEHPERLHDEQVNALVAWPGAPLFVSGSDDTTARFWRLDAPPGRATLLGTLTAAPGLLDPAAAPADPAPGGNDRPEPPSSWVAFTPAGAFDASNDGDRTVAFAEWGRLQPLDQYAERFHKFGLTDRLRHGEAPEPAPAPAPPMLAIDPPAADPAAGPEVRLHVTASDPGLPVDGFRLYQDGVPVRAGPEDFAADGPGRFAVAARLRPGLNRFYAMAARPGDIDARSPDVEVDYDGPGKAGVTHVLALGIADYDANALQFAARDAAEVSAFLRDHGVGAPGRRGKVIPLLDVDVTEKRVEAAFAELHAAIKNHPEDSVVVFLAGHTDILPDPNGQPRFSLLLPNYPFPPGLLAGNARAGGAAGRDAPPAGTYLPYSTIYRHLARLDALQRLVVVDACQAEAARDDPGVRRVQEFLERDARRARTSYLLASRRGEPAGESPALKHGLLTYVLLRGLLAPDLEPVPDGLPGLSDPRGADRNGNHVVTTREIQDYVDRNLPPLAARFPALPAIRGQDRPVPPATRRPEQSLRVQLTEASFPLVRLPGEGVAGR